MRMYSILLVFIVGFIFPGSCFAGCDDQCPPVISEKSQTWKDRMRVKALKNLDQILDWSVSSKEKAFPLVHPLQEKTITESIPEMKEFSEKYGYFSLKRPIVGKVSSDEKDLELVCCLLKTLYDKGANGEYLEIATAEILTKVLAYRDLKVGQTIHIPIEIEGKVYYEPFVVDQVINIWLGMPAIGLVPERENLASLLLFRGTDFSFDSQRGWASLLSDLDIAGPGLNAFRNAQDEISAWLKKVMGMGKTARTMGFSLGGALAAYAFIYENAYVALEGSISVCGPGVAGKVIEDWRSLKQKGFRSYINAGDLVSKVGKLFGPVYCLSTPKACKPLTAHTRLICSEPTFTMALVNVEVADAAEPTHPPQLRTIQLGSGGCQKGM